MVLRLKASSSRPDEELNGTSNTQVLCLQQVFTEFLKDISRTSSQKGKKSELGWVVEQDRDGMGCNDVLPCGTVWQGRVRCECTVVDYGVIVMGYGDMVCEKMAYFGM